VDDTLSAARFAARWQDSALDWDQVKIAVAHFAARPEPPRLTGMKGN